MKFHAMAVHLRRAIAFRGRKLLRMDEYWLGRHRLRSSTLSFFLFFLFFSPYCVQKVRCKPRRAYPVINFQK